MSHKARNRGTRADSGFIRARQGNATRRPPDGL